MALTKPSDIPIWDDTEVNIIEADTDHKNEGWLAPGGVPEKPPFQTFNWFQNLTYQWLRDLNISGILIWDTGTEYDIHSRVIGSDGKIYRSKTTSNTGNDPTSSPANWEVSGVEGVLTTQGDILIRGASEPERLAIGTPGQVLRVNPGATALVYEEVTTITTEGDIIRGDASGDEERLALGTANQSLESNGTNVIWRNPGKSIADSLTQVRVIGVVINAAGFNNLASLSVGTLSVGDLIRTYVTIRDDNTGVQQDRTYRLYKLSGTGVLVYHASETQLSAGGVIQNSRNGYINFSQLWECTTGGTFTFTLDGRSETANINVNSLVINIVDDYRA